MAKKIVIVVDMQGDFMDRPDATLPIVGSSVIINPTNDYLAALDPNEVEAVVFTQDWHAEDHVEYGPDGKPFPKHCVINTNGAKVVVDISAINPAIPVLGLHKNEFDMWVENDIKIFPISNPKLPEIYRDIWFTQHQRNNITDIEMIGVAADICVQAAVAGALNHGFNVSVVENLTKGLFREMRQVVDEDFPGKVTLV